VIGAHYGLDIGRSSVQLVRWRRSGVVGAERRVDAGLTGEARREALAAAVRELAAELGAKGEVDVAVPRAEAIVRRVALPRVAPAELAELIRFQAAKDLPFELDDVELSWCELGETGEGAVDVTFAAVKKETLLGLRDVVAAAGLRPGRLEVSTQAAARALLALAAPADGASATGGRGEEVLVEVGHASSDVIVLHDGRLTFSRSASVGARDEAPGRIVQELERSLVAARAARGLDRTGPTDALYLAGGGAGLPGLADALAERAGVAPRLLAGLGDGSPAGPRFVVARGLADPRPAGGIPDLDLAHRQRARGAAASRRRLLAGVGLGLAAVVGLFLAGRAWVADRTERLARAEAEREMLAPAVERADALAGEVEAARAWRARQGRELEVLLAVARALPEDEAFLTQLRWAEGQDVRIAGRAKEWSSVGRFLNALEREPLIERATFEDIRQPRERGAEGVAFSGTARLRGREGEDE